MKWFRHDTDANMDAKLQEVLLDYGLEGYGLYWYCLELIASNVTPEKLTFELEHDSRIIARNTGSSVQKVQEMMTRFVEVGLFDNSNGRVLCLKLAQRADDYTAKLVRKNGVQPIENNEDRQTPTNSEKVPLDKIKEEEIKEEKKKELKAIAPEPSPAQAPEFVLMLNDKSFHPIYPDDIHRWRELYPAVDVEQQIRSMAGWIEGNPTKRKTKSGIVKFITTWLGKEQNKGGNGNAANQSTSNPRLSDAERVRAKIEQRRAERATASILPRQH